MSDDLMTCLLGLQDSTTYYLEAVRGMHLQVIIDSQSEKQRCEQCQIRRVTRLFFLSPDAPALYCESYLNKEELTNDEYFCLSEQQLPIGKVFVNLNDASSIKKRDISVYVCSNPAIGARMNVHDCMLYCKEYEYWVGDRHIGRIREFFNEESLMRL